VRLNGRRALPAVREVA